jgi:hypothetical protein
MRFCLRRLAFAATCAIGVAGPVAAQTPPNRPAGPGSAREPGFGDGWAFEHPGSPVETLESLTGERATEAGREQEPDEIETDRDSFTPATSTAGWRRLIVESAYSFIDNRRVYETHSFPELILRYGLTDRVELRLGWNYEVGGAGDEISGADAGDELFRDPGGLLRECSLAYGVKVRVSDQAGWRPRSAVILQGLTPTGSGAGATTATQLIATYVAGWQLPNRWRFDTAIRYGTASEAGDRFHLWAPSAVLRVPVGEKWAVHGEYFGIATSGKAEDGAQHYFSPGAHYLVTPDLEVGVRLGWGLNDRSARFFANAGLGWRF